MVVCALSSLIFNEFLSSLEVLAFFNVDVIQSPFFRKTLFEHFQSPIFDHSLHLASLSASHLCIQQRVYYKHEAKPVATGTVTSAEGTWASIRLNQAVEGDKNDYWVFIEKRAIFRFPDPE